MSRTLPFLLRQTRGGFTLLELLIVLAIIAIATAGVTFALRDPDRQAVQREAERLAALLEQGRAWSRTSGHSLRWVERAGGFQFLGRRPEDGQQHWLSGDVAVEWTSPSRVLVLGPEPIIAPQSLTLRLGSERVKVGTDGLRPFSVQSP